MSGTSPSTAGLMLQARHCLRGAQASSVCGVALRCSADSDVVQVYALSGDAHRTTAVYLAGSELDISRAMETKGKGVRFVRRASQFRLECEGTAALAVTIQLQESSTAPYFDLAFDIPASLYGRTVGLLGSQDGNADNDIAYRNGEARCGGK
mmetsp:Transcript_735/g.1215  ORF Transcript_735/g.1215 Transcript_735/m.1215 type:complete len:152 (+) Transcript_735:586-1041(+)